MIFIDFFLKKGPKSPFAKIRIVYKISSSLSENKNGYALAIR